MFEVDRSNKKMALRLNLNSTARLKFEFANDGVEVHHVSANDAGNRRNNLFKIMWYKVKIFNDNHGLKNSDVTPLIFN